MTREPAPGKARGGYTRAVFDHTESSLRGAKRRRLYVLALRRRLALDARCEGCPDRPGGASRKEDEP